MTTLKTITLMSLIILASAWDCEDDEEIQFDCDDCIEAQIDLCNALSASNCSNGDANVEGATSRIIERCDNGSSIAASMKESCGFGELSPTCSGFTCN